MGVYQLGGGQMAVPGPLLTGTLVILKHITRSIGPFIVEIRRNGKPGHLQKSNPSSVNILINKI